MRREALALLELSSPTLKVIDVGAGTGFTTEGIVTSVDSSNVVMVDQSPHQLEKARQKRSLESVRKEIGDAENIPFPNDTFDRYVSAGSIEYWPDPQRGIAESYRVIKEGGKALMVGPLSVRHRLAGIIADAWMLFPTFKNYVEWYRRAGFVDLKYIFIAPEWLEGQKYAIALVGTKPKPGKSPISLNDRLETAHEAMTIRRRIKFVFRFFVGSFFGFSFVPLAFLLSLRNRKRRLVGERR